MEQSWPLISGSVSSFLRSLLSRCSSRGTRLFAGDQHVIRVASEAKEERGKKSEARRNVAGIY